MVATAGGYLTDEKVQELLTMDHIGGFTRWGGSDVTQWSPHRQQEIQEFLEFIAWVFQQILEIREDTAINYRMTVAHNLLVALKEYACFCEHVRQNGLPTNTSRQRELQEIVKLARQGDWCWMGSGGWDLDPAGTRISCNYIIASDEQTSFDEAMALPETRYFLDIFQKLCLSV